MDKNLEIQSISLNKENGSIYVIYKIKNNRSINPKAKRKEDEVLIIGYPKDKIPKEIKEIISATHA